MRELRRVSRLPKAYNARLATPDDTDELARFFGCPARVERRLGRGDACAVVLAGGRICAGAWLVPGPALVAEDWADVRCLYRIPAGVAWGYDGRGTKPGAWGSLMARLPEFLSDLDFQQIAVSIHYNNRLSIDSHLSLGYRSVGWVGCVRLLGLTLRAYCPAKGHWRRLPGKLGSAELRTRRIHQEVGRP